jgi:hypothetical protein
MARELREEEQKTDDSRQHAERVRDIKYRMHELRLAQKLEDRRSKAEKAFMKDELKMADMGGSVEEIQVDAEHARQRKEDIHNAELELRKERKRAEKQDKLRADQETRSRLDEQLKHYRGRTEQLEDEIRGNRAKFDENERRIRDETGLERQRLQEENAQLLREREGLNAQIRDLSVNVEEMKKREEGRERAAQFIERKAGLGLSNGVGIHHDGFISGGGFGFDAGGGGFSDGGFGDDAFYRRPRFDDFRGGGAVAEALSRGKLGQGLHKRLTGERAQLAQSDPKSVELEFSPMLETKRHRIAIQRFLRGETDPDFVVKEEDGEFAVIRQPKKVRDAVPSTGKTREIKSRSGDT